MTSRDIRLRSGRRVHLVEAGTGAPVLFLHGSNTSSRSLFPLFEHLRDVRAIAVDRPGFGLSDAAPVPRARFRAAAVEFIDEIVEALALQRPTLAGSSMGGTWALWYALAHPERVGRLVLLGSAPLLPGTHAPAPLRVLSAPIAGALLARVMKPSARMVVRLMGSMGEAGTIVRYPDLIESLVVAGRDRAATAVNRAEIRAVLTPLGFRRSMLLPPDELRRVRAPALLIWGDEDPVGTAAAARTTARLLPDARLELLSAGHVPYLGHPERTAELVTEFAMASPLPA
jgi:pimeloyl-ACP methyl ester carboxylesterase